MRVVADAPARALLLGLNRFYLAKFGCDMCLVETTSFKRRESDPGKTVYGPPMPDEGLPQLRTHEKVKEVRLP